MRALALFCFGVIGFAQQASKPEAQPAPPTLRITVTLVQVDAVVTDAHGKRVIGLTADDFELLQDGAPQKITYFSYVPQPEPTPREAEAKGEKLPAVAPKPITAGEVKRTVALVVDDLALSFDSIVRVRAALRQYIEKEMEPGDLVAIVRTGGGVALLEQFTTDKRLLLEAVDLLKWRFNGRAGLGTIDPLAGERNEGPQRLPEMLDYGYTLSALGSLETMEQVVRGMRALPGRKSVVLLSDSLNVDSEIAAAIEKLTDLANRSAVSIYTVDPRGLQTGMSAAEIAMAQEATRPAPGPTPNRGRGGVSNVPVAQIPDEPNPTRPQDRNDPIAFPLPPGAAEVFSLGGLADLAKGTGGMFFANRNDIAGCVREAAADQLGYYLLGYTPAEGTFDADPANAKFHRVTVRMRRGGMRVRWKSGFEGVPDQLELTDNTKKTREQELLEALASPFAATGIPVRLTSLFSYSKAAGPFIHSLLYFDAHGLTFAKEPDGMWHATVDVVATAYRGIKQTTLQLQRVQEIVLPDELYQRALQEGFLYAVNTPMKEPGMFLMRVVVRDHGSEKLGSASQFLVTPDTRKGRLALSSVRLQLAPANLLRQAGIEPPAEGDGQVQAWSEGGPAVRRYHGGQNVVYGYIVINPKVTGAEQTTKATVQVRIYRNGKLLYTGKPQSNLQNSKEDRTNFLGAGVLRLGSEMEPGEYLIQVTVTDPLRKKKESQASQWADFEVVGAGERTSHGN